MAHKLLDCVFEQVSSNECPENAIDLRECGHNMATGTLCEADQALPGSEETYNVDNCGVHDVFKCVRGECIQVHLVYLNWFG